MPASPPPPLGPRPGSVAGARAQRPGRAAHRPVSPPPQLFPLTGLGPAGPHRPFRRRPNPFSTRSALSQMRGSRWRSLPVPAHSPFPLRSFPTFCPGARACLSSLGQHCLCDLGTLNIHTDRPTSPPSDARPARRARPGSLAGAATSHRARLLSSTGSLPLTLPSAPSLSNSLSAPRQRPAKQEARGSCRQARQGSRPRLARQAGRCRRPTAFTRQNAPASALRFSAGAASPLLRARPTLSSRRRRASCPPSTRPNSLGQARPGTAAGAETPRARTQRQPPSRRQASPSRKSHSHVRQRRLKKHVRDSPAPGDCAHRHGGANNSPLPRQCERSRAAARHPIQGSQAREARVVPEERADPPAGAGGARAQLKREAAEHGSACALKPVS